MVATKQNSIQMHEDLIEDEGLCVAGVCCVYQEDKVGDETGKLGLD